MPSDVLLSEIKTTRELKSLTLDERKVLVGARNQKLLRFVSAYITFVGILILAWIKGWLDSFSWGEEGVERVRLLAPYFFGFLFILLTTYFARTYFKDIHPFVKDLKGGLKEEIFFKPGIYQTPFFEEFFLKIPLKQKTLLEISKELYNSISPNDSLTILFAPHSELVFAIVVNNKEHLINRM